MNDGYNRIKELYLQGTCRDNSLKKIVMFLMKQNNMNDCYLKEEKNLIDMMQFITNNAREFAVNNVAVLTDDEVFDLAIKYFSISNDELGINKQIPKINSSNNKSNNVENNEQLKLELGCT